MRILIDTHILLWWEQESPLLSKAVRDLLANPNISVFVSAVTPWEIAIKIRKKKLAFEGSPSRFVAANGFQHLPITAEHGETAGQLDWDHTDPFDRMLVAQAQIERLTLVHADKHIRGYGAVAQLWAR